MKLSINTTDKTIQIDEIVNIDEFVKEIKKMFPNDAWKKYKLVIGKSEPIILKEKEYVPVPYSNPVIVPYNPHPIWYDNLPYTGSPLPGQMPYIGTPWGGNPYTYTCGTSTYTQDNNMLKNTTVYNSTNEITCHNIIQNETTYRNSVLN